MQVQSLLTLLACASSALAMKFTDTKMRFRPPKPAADAPPTTGDAIFQQNLNHDDPSAGTFSQKYWYNDQWWGGPGSPVVLFTPGEIAAEGYQGYLTNNTITGAYAQAIQGAVVMLEHRFWGNSSPYDTLSTTNLQQLTLKNSIADLTHFARTVQLPFDKNGSSNAPQAPWVLSGGSYSGALSSWTASTAPGTFWAYHSSSAPVQAIYDYVSARKELCFASILTASSGNISTQSSKGCRRTAQRTSRAWWTTSTTSSSTAQPPSKNR